MNYEKEELEDKMTSDNYKYRYYLMDLGPYLKKFAFDAKEKYHKDKSNKFNSGYYSAFHRIISFIMQQAESIGIELKELRLDDIDPDKDLIG